MIIEGKFLDLNLKKNTIDNYHYFDSLEILCNKFVINQLKSRFEYLLNDHVANLIKNLKKSKKVIISRNLIDKNLSLLKYQYLMKFFTLSSNNSENSLFFSIDNQSLTQNSEYLPFLSEILLGKDLQVAFEPKFFASEITLNCIYCSIIPVIKGVVVLSEVNFPNINNSIKTTNEAIGKYLNI